MLSSDLRHFVSDKLGVPSEDLRPTDRLQNELGLDGADAADFVAAFAERFGVDMAAFAFDRHFGRESAGCIPLWIVWLLVPPLRPKVAPISLSDLQRAIDTRRWPKIRAARPGKRD